MSDSGRSDSGPSALTFTEDDGELSASLLAAHERLRSLVSRLAADRGKSPESCRIRYGRRTGGGRAGVPAIRQYGFRIEVESEEAEAPHFPCFLLEDDVLEDHDLAETLLGLWLDRQP